MAKAPAIALARGDGIGPEIMEAVLLIINEAGAHLDLLEIEIGEKAYKNGHPTGIPPEAWETIRGTEAFLKSPITTPQGGGYKSLNVTIRTSLGLYANIRPCTSYHPFVATKHPGMDLVIVRENEEDLYAGIEYKQTPDATIAHKLITHSGSEKIIRHAFEYARHHKRKKVTCFSKDNILKITDGLFHKTYEEVAKEYPDLETEHWIIDIGAAKLADTPEAFDVIVLANLYGDILSDIAAQIAGSVGMGGSANIGDHGAMFEAIHGSAPTHAGQGIANPSGLLHAAILLLEYVGQGEIANRIENAWLCAIERGIHTPDIYSKSSKRKVGTMDFAHAVIKFLGEKPEKLKAASFAQETKINHLPTAQTPSFKRELIGVDIFTYARTETPLFLERIKNLPQNPLHLHLITNRGVVIWPNGHLEASCTDQWRMRFLPEKKTTTQEEILATLQMLTEKGFDIIRTENLYRFNDKPAFSSADI